MPSPTPQASWGGDRERAVVAAAPTACQVPQLSRIPQYKTRGVFNPALEPQNYENILSFLYKSITQLEKYSVKSDKSGVWIFK